MKKKKQAATIAGHVTVMYVSKVKKKREKISKSKIEDKRNVCVIVSE